MSLFTKGLAIGIIIGWFIGILFGAWLSYMITKQNVSIQKKELTQMNIKLNQLELYVEQAIPVLDLFKTVDSFVQVQEDHAYLPVLDTPYMKSTMNFGVGGQDPDSSLIERD